MTAFISGFGGVVVGALVALHVNRQQIKSTTISTNRQAWINSLRDEISSCIAALEVTGFSCITQNIFSQEEKEKAILTLLGHEAKIRLLINPYETDHKQLIEVLHKALKVSFLPKTAHETNEDAASKIKENVGKIISISQAILKREWQRVKSGE